MLRSNAIQQYELFFGLPLASLIVAMVWVPRVLGVVSFHPSMGEVQVRDQFRQDLRK